MLVFCAWPLEFISSIGVWNYHFWSADITLFMLSIFLSHYMVVLDLFVSSEKGIFLFFTFILFPFNILVLVVYYRRIGHGDLRWKRLCIYCTSVYLSKFHLALPYIFKRTIVFWVIGVLMLCCHRPWVYNSLLYKSILVVCAMVGHHLKYKMITLQTFLFWRANKKGFLPAA